MDNHDMNTSAPQTIDAPVGRWIEAGFFLYKENFSTLVPAMLIVFLLSLFSLFILFPPLLLGFLLMTLRLATGGQPPPTVGDVFSGFSHFLDAFLFILIWSNKMHREKTAAIVGGGRT